MNMLYLYCYVCSKSEEHQGLQRFWTLLDLLERRKSGYGHSCIVFLYKHFAWIVWVFLVVFCVYYVVVLTWSPRVFIPITELATPLGIIILLFPIWVVQCKSGLSLWFDCCYSLTWSSRVSNLKSDLFDLAFFFIFLAKIYIRTLLYLQ